MNHCKEKCLFQIKKQKTLNVFGHLLNLTQDSGYNKIQLNMYKFFTNHNTHQNYSKLRYYNLTQTVHPLYDILIFK